MRRWVVLFALSSVGCSYHVWSPPARVMPMEDVGALAPGEVRIQGMGHGHGGIAIFETRPVPAGGAAEMAVGLGADVDLRLTGQALALAAGERSEVSHDRGVFGARAGVRFAPAPWIALSTGVGGGGHAAGGFVAPDLGVTLGHRATRVGVFVDVRVGGSFPIDAQPLDLTRPGDEERHYATPLPTAILQVTPGMRFAVVEPAQADVGVDVRLAPNLSLLIDREEASYWVGGGVAVELSFGARAEPPEPPEPPARIGPAT